MQVIKCSLTLSKYTQIKRLLGENKIFIKFDQTFKQDVLLFGSLFGMKVFLDFPFLDTPSRS